LAISAAKIGDWDSNIKTGDFYLDSNIKAILGYADVEIPNDIEIWVELNTVKITWEGKSATLNFLRDITVQRKLEQQLQVSHKYVEVSIADTSIGMDENKRLIVIFIGLSRQLAESRIWVD
jgi:hypothetical protein